MSETLPIQKLREGYYEALEAQILRVLFDLIFAPVVKLVTEHTAQELSAEVRNSPEDVIVKALSRGKLQYANGIFSGDLNARIAVALRSLGAAFDRRRGVYTIKGQPPAAIVAAAISYQERAKGAHQELVRKLDSMVQKVDVRVSEAKINLEPGFREIEDDFKIVAQDLAVKPEMTDQAKDAILREYTDNMKLSIKNFADQEIRTLRDTVEANAQQGYRFDKLSDQIQDRYGVTERKAKFLARNETSILMSDYQEQRFKAAGVRRYIWQTANQDERVRDSHRELNGKIFFFDDPPLIDSTGRKCNPGQDYGCRCIARPILEEV